MCETTGFFNALPVGNGHSSDTDVSTQKEVIHLRHVDSVEITIIVDNFLDYLLQSDKRVRRPSVFGAGWSKRPQLAAEHGYSVLFTFRKKGEEKSLLYDAGLTPETVTHNLDVLGIQSKNLDAIVLSHGHVDHHGGLIGLLRKIGKRNLPIIMHPEAWRNRKVMLPFRVEWDLPPPDRKALEKEDVRLVEDPGPSLLLSDEALVTGQVERVTDFEKGLKFQYAQTNGGWSADPWIWDDQGVICNINGKGLVVVSGCSHAGVVNILRHAQKITGVNKIHAFIGGLHLPSLGFEEIIPPTIKELERIHPDIIVPGHCTGWKATHEIARRLPDAFIPSSVGSQILFG